MARREELLAAAQRHGINIDELRREVGSSGQASLGGGNNQLSQLLQQAQTGGGVSPTRQGVANIFTVAGGGEAVDTGGGQSELVQGLLKTALTQQVKSQFDQPTSLELGADVRKQKEFSLKQQKELREQTKFEQETAEEEVATEEREESARAGANDLLDTIKEVKKGSRFFGFAGKVPTFLTALPTSANRADRIRWEANVEKLLSKRVIEVMSEMKRISKTGATGFGQLSEKELAVLQNASTALRRDLDPKDALKLLDEMERIQKKFLAGSPGTVGEPSVEADAGSQLMEDADGNRAMVFPDGRVQEL